MLAGGLVTLAMLSALYYFCGAMNTENAPWYFSSKREYQGMLLLMILLPVYIVASSVYSQRRALQIAGTVDKLNNLDLSTKIQSVSVSGLSFAALFGFLYAVLFNIPGNGLNFLVTSPTERAMIFGQTMIWMMLTSLLYVRFTTSREFRAASEQADIDIFEPSNLRPFAQVGLIDLLIIVVGLVVSTVQSLDFGFRPDNYSKALVILVPASIFLVIYPIWGIHQRMKQMRQDQLDELNLLIRNASKTLNAEDLHQLEVLLQRRERVSAAPAWPVDISTLQRFFLYIIIPPLAWVGAALVELIIDGILTG